MDRTLASRELFHETIRNVKEQGYLVSNDEKAQTYALTAPVLEDGRFYDCPGSRTGKHHYYRGGLAAHTFQVMTLALGSAFVLEEMGEYIDYVVLITSAVWHDWGKMDEYIIPANLPLPGHDFEEGAIFFNTDITSHHITRAAARIGACGVDDPKRLEHILHVIEAHHGRRDWGSPNAPKTLEAMLLHHADMVSVMADSGDNPTNR